MSAENSVGGSETKMSERPHLVIEVRKKEEPFAYECSVCRQKFVLPEDRSPKEAVAELLDAFNEHVQKEHPAPAEPQM